MNGKIQFQFTAKLWRYEGQGAWYFVSLPEELSKEIRDNLRAEEEGWGRLKAVAKVGNSEWKTAIWFATKANTYLLPVKAEIRKTEELKMDRPLKVTLWV